MSAAAYFKGQRVRHRDLGPGTVRVVSPNGVLKVFFDLISDVEVVEASSLVLPGLRELETPLLVSTAQPVAPSRVGSEPSATHAKRLTIECLRQGLPPPGKLTSWTVGHRKARDAIDTAIAQARRGNGSTMFLRAGYGQGKSHLGRLGGELAREQGFASFHVELDGSGVSLSQGSRLVAALFASARLPDADSDHEHLVPGLATILKRAAPAAKAGVPFELEAFAPFLQEPSRWVESDEIVEVLELYLSGYMRPTDASRVLADALGVKPKLKSLRMDYGLAEHRRRSQAEQLARIVSLVRLAGAKGAFIVIDELDHDYQADAYKQNAMLGELARVAASQPVVLLLLAREVPMQGLPAIDLGEFSESEFERLVDKTIDAFAEVYPAPALLRGRKELFALLQEEFGRSYKSREWGPRYFVRAAIEACEATRAHGLDSLSQVRVSDGGRVRN